MISRALPGVVAMVRQAEDAGACKLLQSLLPNTFYAVLRGPPRWAPPSWQLLRARSAGRGLRDAMIRGVLALTLLYANAILPLGSCLHICHTLQVGTIRLAAFNSRAVPDVVAAVRRLEDAGARELVLDLRDNRGGLVQEGVELARLFLDGAHKGGSGSRVFCQVKGVMSSGLAMEGFELARLSSWTVRINCCFCGFRVQDSRAHRSGNIELARMVLDGARINCCLWREVGVARCRTLSGAAKPVSERCVVHQVLSVARVAAGQLST